MKHRLVDSAPNWTQARHSPSLPLPLPQSQPRVNLGEGAVAHDLLESHRELQATPCHASIAVPLQGHIESVIWALGSTVNLSLDSGLVEVGEPTNQAFVVRCSIVLLIAKREGSGAGERPTRNPCIAVRQRVLPGRYNRSSPSTDRSVTGIAQRSWTSRHKICPWHGAWTGLGRPYIYIPANF